MPNFLKDNESKEQISSIFNLGPIMLNTNCYMYNVIKIYFFIYLF